MQTPQNTDGDLEHLGRGVPKMVARSLASGCLKPRLVLAYVDSTHAALSCRHLRRQGWEVHLASSAGEARRLTLELAPQVLVLDTELPDESGWLICAKLLAANLNLQVVLVGPKASTEDLKRADFVGAFTLIERSAGPDGLVGGVLAHALTAAS
jgi:DNA-binding response OmpR family regulator